MKELLTDSDSNDSPHRELASLTAEDSRMFAAMMQALHPPGTNNHTALDYVDHMSIVIKMVPLTPINGSLTQWEQKLDHTMA
jgi:hypothetical protein